MTEQVAIRESTAGDRADIEAFYPEAFPEEDLLPLVRTLLEGAIPAISLVATAGGSAVGHVVFTRCGVAGDEDGAALLGPLAVAPAWQGQGIGSALVRAGFERLEAAGVAHVLVLGDPAYYRRFGFARERDVSPPYPLPVEWDDAWQSRSAPGAATRLRGTLVLPEPWLRRELWMP